MNRLVLGLVMAIAVGGATADEAGLERLASARALWESAAASDYRYGYEKHCECYRDAPPVTVVTVAGGTIERVFHRHDDSEREVPAREGSLDLYWTIDDLFDKLAGAYAREAVVRVDYDPVRGYPQTLYIDYDPTFSGDETDLRLTQFEVL